MAAANYTTGAISVVTGYLGVYGAYASAAVIPHDTAICACGAVNEVAKIRTSTKYMKETMSYPCSHTNDQFHEAIKRNPPLWIAEQMITKLDQELTNPLNLAMNNDPLKRKETFEKWRNIIDGVLGESLFLETYQNGMFCDENMIGPNRLKRQIKELEIKVDKWDDEYRKDGSYWDAGVLKLIHKVQDNYDGIKSRADVLQSELNKIMTEHKFYVIVYDPCFGYENHAFCSCGNNVLFSHNRGGCNVVVFRSFRTRDCGQHARDLRLKLDASLPMPYALRDKLDDYVVGLCERFGGECGFVMLIRKNLNFSKRWVNCDPDEYPRGPGAFLSSTHF